jgi:hypothetical protein
MVNVSNNKEIIRMSQKTIAPLKFVPYILLHINGKPFMRYDGPHDEEQIRRFILEVAKQLEDKPHFANTVASGKKELPGYSIGQPVCGEDNVCYLEYEEAYGENGTK